MRGSPPAWPPAALPERRAVDLDGEEPTGPMTLMFASAEGYVVIVEPTTPTGNYRREFYSKIDAMSYARTLWGHFRTGFADHSTGNEKRTATGPYRPR